MAAPAWFAIGLSVMATQASAITFLSTPGQGYLGGLGFLQIYFGVPLALIIIAAVFLPIYRRLNVYTAYEFLGKRFDSKTRSLGAALFLLQRGLGAGLTIYGAVCHSFDNGLWLAVESDDYLQRVARYYLHGDGRERCRNCHAEISTRHYLRRYDHCVLPPRNEVA